MSILTTITLDNTLTNGTLTSNELSTLKSSKTNYIMYGTELYKLFDNGTDLLIYTCVTTLNSSAKIKVITVTISTLAWEYAELSVGMSEEDLTPILASKASVEELEALKIEVESLQTAMSITDLTEEG